MGASFAVNGRRDSILVQFNSETIKLNLLQHNGTEIEYKMDCDDLRNASFRPGYHPILVDRPAGAMAQTVLFYLQNALLGSFVLIFIFFKFLHPSRERYSRLQERPLIFVIMPCFGASLVTVVGSYYQSHELEDGMPCWVFIAAYFNLVPLLVFPLTVRMLSHYRSAQWTVAVINVTKQATGDKDAADVESGVAASDTVSVAESADTRSVAAGDSQESFWRSFVRIMFCLDRRRMRRKLEEGTVAPMTQTEAGDQASLAGTERGRRAQAKSRETELKIVKFLKSNVGASLFLMAVFLPYLLTMAISLGTTPMVIGGCYGCSPTRAQEIVLIIGALFALFLVIVAYRVNLNRKDPFGIVNEARMACFLGGVPAVVFLICNSAFKPFTQGDFQFIMLVEISLVIFCFVQSALQCVLAVLDARSETSAMASIAYSLKEFERDFVRKDGRFYEAFSRHLASEHGYESLAFLSSVFQWEKEFFDVSPKTARARAKKIVNMYVGVDAELPCNLSSNCVHLIETYLKRGDDDLKYDFFGLAKSELIKMLYGDSFRRFVKSKEYRGLVESKEIVSVKL